MTRIFALLLLLCGSAWAADNTVVVTPGSGVTMRSLDVGSGVQSMRQTTVTPFVTATSTFDNPSSTAYAVGDLVANSGTAGSVTPLSWTVNIYSAQSAYIERVRMSTSKTGNLTAPNFRIHLYTVSPTVTNGDNAAFLSTFSGYIGAMDCNMPTTSQFSDGNWCQGASNIGSRIIVSPVAQTLYGLIEARGAYAGTSGEHINVYLELSQP